MDATSGTRMHATKQDLLFELSLLERLGSYALQTILLVFAVGIPKVHITEARLTDLYFQAEETYYR
jgi:hypothetical protein